MSCKAVVFHPTFAEKYARMLRSRFPDVSFQPIGNPPQATEAIEHAEIVLAHISLPGACIENANSLRWIQVLGAGVDKMLPSVPPGVRVSRLTGSFGDRMAEYVLAYILAIEQRIPEVVRNTQERTWEPLELGVAAGKTVGVAGLGSIGEAIASLCSRVGMQVVGLSSRPSKLDCLDDWFGKDSLHDFLSAPDYVVLALPATKATHHIIDEKSIKMMHDEAWLMNVSRGSLVDQNALLAGLQSGRPAGAVLDVFETEPLPQDHPFWDMPNVIVTPHQSGSAIPEEAVDVFAENLPRYLNGEPLINEVDVTRGY